MSLELKNVNNSGYTELRNLYNSGYFSLAFSGSEVPTTTTTTSTTSTTTTAPTTTTTTTTTTSTTTSTTTAAPTTTSTTTTTTTAAPTTTTSTTTTTTTAASGDLIRAALQPSFTASYDAAAIGSFINVNSASYNSVFANLSNATRYGQTNAVLTGSIGGGSSWGAPFAFAFTASVIPSGNYIVGYATVIASAGASQSLAIYYSTASNATASTAIGDRIAPANSFISSGSNSVYYFIRKAPTDTLPANSVMYLWSTGSLTIKGPNIARIPYKLVNGPAPLQITGSWLSWNTVNTGQPGHQFIATSQLQW